MLSSYSNFITSSPLTQLNRYAHMKKQKRSCQTHTASFNGCSFRCRITIDASVDDAAQMTSLPSQDSTRHTAVFVIPRKTCDIRPLWDRYVMHHAVLCDVDIRLCVWWMFFSLLAALWLPEFGWINAGDCRHMFAQITLFCQFWWVTSDVLWVYSRQVTLYLEQPM